MTRGPVSKRSKKTLTPSTDGSQPSLPADVKWHPETVAWWAALGRSGEATEFHELDWLQLRLVARLMDSFIREPSRQLLAELRLQLAKYGLSPEDRARLRWETKTPDAEPTTPTAGSSRSRTDPRKAPTK